jgi:hypothetical protein
MCVRLEIDVFICKRIFLYCQRMERILQIPPADCKIAASARLAKWPTLAYALAGDL